MKMTRRKFLLLGSGAIVLSGFSLHNSSKESFLLEHLHKLMGEFDMAESDFQQLNDHFRAFISEQRYERYRQLILLEKLTVHGHFDPLNIHQRMDKWDRRLVTQFITSTDYIERPDNQIRFLGGNLPCRNPFADYSLS